MDSLEQLKKQAADKTNEIEAFKETLDDCLAVYEDAKNRYSNMLNERSEIYTKIVNLMP